MLTAKKLHFIPPKNDIFWLALTPPIAPAAEPAPPAAAPETPAARPVPAPDPVTAPAPAVPVLETAPVPVPAEAKPEPTASPDPAPEKPPEPPVVDLTPEADAEDEAERKRVHEEAEAKRKAEFDAEQAKKRAAEQEQLDRIAAMDDDAAIAEAVRQVGDMTDKMTNRSMKDSVSAHIQALCRADPAFARLAMHPRKSMLHCIQYIFRHARDYLEKELKAGGIKVSGTYGGDVPDGLCYEWAEKYFRDMDAKKDKEDEEKFVSKPYVPSRKASKPKAAKKPEKKKPAAEKPKAPAMEQISLM